MAKGNSQRDKFKLRLSCNSMHGCVQGENSIWWKYWQVKNWELWLREICRKRKLVGDTWSPTASMRTLKYFLACAAKNKARVHQLDFIGALFQAKVKNRVFVKLDVRYTDYFPEYAKYFGRALILWKSMYSMTNSGELFSDELT